MTIAFENKLAKSFVFQFFIEIFYSLLFWVVASQQRDKAFILIF